MGALVRRVLGVLGACILLLAQGRPLNKTKRAHCADIDVCDGTVRSTDVLSSLPPAQRKAVEEARKV
eukprot:2046217-Pyramimonas_sp.AAC.1